MTAADAGAAIPVSRRMRTAKSDAVTLLSVYAGLLFFIPASQIFAPLGDEGTPALVFSLLIFFQYLASWISGRTEPTGGGRLVRIAMLLFVLAVLASYAAAMTRQISQTEVLAADSGLIWLASSVGLVVVITETVRDYSRLDLLLRRLVLCASIIAVVGILQSRGIDLVKYVQIPGLKENSASLQMSRDSFVRPESTASQPIEFGVVMAMILPISIQQAFHKSYGGRFRRWLPVALIGIAAPLTVSRSGVLGVIVALLVLLPSWRPARVLGAIGVIALAVGVMRVATHGLISTLIAFFAEIFNGQDSSVNARVADYSGVAQYFSERPVFGRGFNTFLPLLYRYTDNMYLHAIIEVGIVGTLIFFFIFCAGIQSAARGKRRAADLHEREMGQALIASMAVAMITSVTFDSLSFPMFSGVFFTLLGCCGAYGSMAATKTENPALGKLLSPAHFGV